MRSTLRVPFALLALTGALVLAACSEEDEVEQEPDVAIIEINFGGNSVRINSAGTVTGGSLTFPIGQTNVTARFLRANGSEDPLATEEEFELRIVPGSTAIATFTSLGGFDGRITGIAAGTTLTRFQLFHIEEQHEDFEVSVNITIE